jgi:hypothetical protein
MRFAVTLMATLATASACHVQTLPAAKKPPHPAATSDTLAASPLVASSIGAFHRLLPLSLDAVTLTGKVKIDASYVLSVNAGNLLSNNGGGVLANNGASVLVAGGGKLVSDNGGGIIANNAGSVIAAPGGNVVSDQAGSLVSDQGGGLIGNNGGGLVSDNGGGLVSNNGGGLVSNNGGGLTGKTKWQLLLADPTPAKAATGYGDQLTAVGMRVLLVDPTSGHLLPLGKDETGKPAYAIYTGLDGGYKLYVPKTLSGAVRVVAFVPDHKEARLGYNVFAKPGLESLIDEDHATVTQYVRLGLRFKFENLIVLNSVAGSGGLPSDDVLNKFFGQARAPEAFRGILNDIFKRLFTEIARNPAIHPSDYGPLAQAMSDLLLSRADDLESVMLDPSYFGNKASQDAILGAPHTTGKALENLRALLGEVRQKVIAQGDTPDQVAAAFSRKGYLATANLYHARLHPQDPRPYYEIRKSSDLADFLAREYFSMVPGTPYGCTIGDCPATNATDCIVTDKCLPPAGVASLSNAQIFALEDLVMDDLGLPRSDVSVINAVGEAFSFTVGLQLQDKLVMNDVLALIQGYGKPTASVSP